MIFKLKRIIAAIVASSMFSVIGYAFTPYMPEDLQTEESVQDESAGYEREQIGTGIVSNFKPREFEYRLFLQILEEYTANHLFEFTQEDVLYKFFEDFLRENPRYMKVFLDYILGTMDPYSSYYEASSGFLETNSSAFGFGFTIKNKDDGVYIESVLPGANAEKAGFMAGDKFIAIAGIDIEHQAYDVITAILADPIAFMSKEQIEDTDEKPEETLSNDVEQFVAEDNPKIEITVERNGEKLTISTQKGPMELSEINSIIDPNNGKPTAYIQISSFLGENTDTEFVELVKKYASDGIKHLTIDLRDNGGGSLDYALTMAEIFLEKDELICYYNDKYLEKPRPILSTNGKVSFDSITILINEHTASAAELFTSILSDKNLAKTVGTKSYGKSLGQTVYSLANGDHITITTYQMLNTSLESYDGIGLLPDISIEDVEMCFTLPALGIFNHQNVSEIKEGQYSDVTKALEDRLVIMDILREEYADGVFDDITKTALYIFQMDHKIEATGYVTYDTVSKITKIINSYKPFTYYDDTQYEVAMIIHHSFSQGKRLAAEKEKLREEQQQLISERDAALNEAYDATHSAVAENPQA